MYEHMIGSGYPIDEKGVSAFEEKYRIKLPLDYRKFILRFNGGNNGEYSYYVRAQNDDYGVKKSIFRIESFLPLYSKAKYNIEDACIHMQSFSHISDKYLMISLDHVDFVNIFIGIHSSNYGEIFVADEVEVTPTGEERPWLTYLCPSWNDLINGLVRESECSLVADKLEEGENKSVTDNISRVTDRPLTLEEVYLFEQRVGFSLPADYKYFLHTDNGTITSKKFLEFFDVIKHQKDSIILDFYTVGSKFATRNLEINYQMFVDYFNGVRLLLPIGEWEGGDFVCLDLSPQKFGKIFFVMHDYFDDPNMYNFISPVADSFDDFLKILKPVEEDKRL